MRRNGPFDGKVTRFVTSIALPIDEDRTGDCMKCGACCKFLIKCPLLKEFDTDPPTYKCRAYAIRPPQCRKYPRTEREQMHQPCGYYFTGTGEDRGKSRNTP